MITRRLRNLYVCEGATVELGGRFHVDIDKTTPTRCVVLVKRMTKVRITLVKSDDYEEEEEDRMIETAASDAVENVLSSRRKRTILLYGGVQGSGKSEAARLAARKHRPRIKCEALDLKDLAIGSRSGWDDLEALFERASLHFKRPEASSPPFIILDSLEAICLRSDDANTLSKSEAKSALCHRLAALVREASAIGISVCGTTRNLLDDLEPAVVEAFSSSAKYKMLPPDKSERRRLLEAYCPNQTSPPSLLEDVAARTIGYVAADIAKLTLNARHSAERRRRRMISGEDGDDSCVTQQEVPFDIVSIREDPANVLRWEDFNFSKVKASCLEGMRTEMPKVKWSDIGGQAEAKLKLQMAIEWPHTKKHLFERFRIEPIRGVLMYGPPGCSKTMLARACATESQAAFISLSGADVYSPFLGEAEATVRRAFDAAETATPAILFFDEIDALVTDRSVNPDAASAESRVLATFLTCLDGVSGPRKGVVTIGATNRPHAIDSALLRPGRLETKICVGLPDKQDRVEILTIHARTFRLAEPIDFYKIASATRGFSGADLGNLCREAAFAAFRRISQHLQDNPETDSDTPSDTTRRTLAMQQATSPDSSPFLREDVEDVVQVAGVINLDTLRIRPELKGLTNDDFAIALSRSRATIDLNRAASEYKDGESPWNDHVNSLGSLMADTE